MALQISLGHALSSAQRAPRSLHVDLVNQSGLVSSRSSQSQWSSRAVSFGSFACALGSFQHLRARCNRIHRCAKKKKGWTVRRKFGKKKTVLESRTFKMKSNVHHAAVGLNMFDLWNHFEMCLLVAHAIA